jgi:2-polyprenyl-6-methoxyphenol hydroxylase-like FAD-dependent oxidoreductase
MACISNALMVGGGIAGLSSALALSNAGVQCDVVELNNTSAGAAIGITGRAADALGELGVYDECFAVSTAWRKDSTVASQMDASGALISAGPPRPEWPGQKTGIGILRPLLLQALADGAKGKGATIKNGITVDSIEEQVEGALVRFSDGTERHYDLVLGADGINSKVRSLVFPDAPKPAYSGQFSVRWMVEGPPLENEAWYISPLGKLGLYNLPQGVTYVAAVVTIPDNKWMNKQEVHALYTGLLDSFTAPTIVELRRRLTADADLVARPFEWLLLPAPWHRGRVLMVGDAAHATTAHLGMGGGMALEDAVVLGQCIAQAATLPEAFDLFMARRFERVRTVVQTSLALSQLEQRGAPRTEAIGMVRNALVTISAPY